jgi:hypothetical protein
MKKTARVWYEVEEKIKKMVKQMQPHEPVVVVLAG